MSEVKVKRAPTANDLISYMTEQMLAMPYGDLRNMMETRIQMFEGYRDRLNEIVTMAYETFPKARNPLKDFLDVGLRVYTEGEISGNGFSTIMMFFDDAMGPSFVKNDDEVWAAPKVIAKKPETTGQEEMQAQAQLEEIMRKMGVGLKK